MKRLSSIDKALILESIDLFSRIYWEPDQQFAQTIWEGGLTEYFTVLDQMLSGRITKEIVAFEQEREKHKNPDDLYQILNITYVRLFVNSRKGIAVPLYQSSYSGETSILMGPPAIQMKKRFEESGLTFANSHNEPPDHLSVELEYLFYLFNKGWEANDNKVLEEAARFVHNNLIPWNSKFVTRLQSNQELSFYGPLSTILHKFLLFL